MSDIPHSLRSSTVAAPTSSRLLSVDALRGFDMLWITGAAAFVRALDKMNQTDTTKFLSTQFTHCKWEGLRFYDLIFPLFLFLMGVSLVFSIDKTIELDGKTSAISRILRRSILLFLLGVFRTGGLSEPWPAIQLGGVLQRIAACYLASSLIYLLCRSHLRMMFGITVGLLVGYWALLTYVPFPDLLLNKANVQTIAQELGTNSPAAIAGSVSTRVRGVYEEGRNLTNYIDFRYLRGKKTQVYYINEGLLSTMSSIAICLFGAFAGQILKRESVPPSRKALLICLGGLALIAVGMLWSIQFPLIKRIWTSSFCLVASGFAAIFLSLFYYIIDVRGFRKWCQPFVWIGTNSITIYLAVYIVDFPKLAEKFVGGDIHAYFEAHVAKGFGDLVIAMVALLLSILLCRFLYHRRIFLRV